MVSEIFVDTSGFYACLVKKDNRHDKAVTVLRSSKGRRRFVTTDYVLDETITLLRMRGHSHLIEEFTRIALRSQVCRVEWMDPKRFDAVHGFLVQHGDDDYSFTDCFSFLVMKENNLRDALTKDEHFSEAGFQPLLI
jgi:predicted nucleic acid-binding protein